MSTVRLVCFMIICGFAISFSGGYGSGSGSGGTLAPGENGRFCGSSGCHVGNTFGTSLGIELRNEDGDLLSSYIPGAVHKVKLDINTTQAPSGYGFQVVALQEDETSVDTWDAFPSGVSDITLSNRQYVEQIATLSNSSIELEWTAPTGNQDVTFYFAGNAINGNGNSAGDSAAADSFTFTADQSSSTKDLVLSGLSVFPNPVQDLFTLNHEVDQVEIFNLNGNLVYFRNNMVFNHNIQNLNSGLYFLHAQVGNERKIIKLYKM